MEYDRKSAVSSFYGGRPSGDALNHDYSSPSPTAPPDGRARRDSASSFFNPNAGNASRPSADVLRGQSAGYNRQSFFDAGRQEPIKGGYNDEEAHGNDAGWDVFADFNNTGPRYSTAFGLGQSEARCVVSSLCHNPMFRWSCCLPIAVIPFTYLIFDMQLPPTPPAWHSKQTR